MSEPIDLRGNSKPYVRGANSAMISSMPPKYDILKAVGVEDQVYLLNHVDIAVYTADFRDNATDIILGEGNDATGVNLLFLNGVHPDGQHIPGHYTEITIAASSQMVIIAWPY